MKSQRSIMGFTKFIIFDDARNYSRAALSLDILI